MLRFMAQLLIDELMVGWQNAGWLLSRRDEP